MKRETPSLPGFRLEQTFFGFKPEDRVALHETIFNLIWAGAGRWDWDTIYTMPIPIRRFWISKLNKMQDEAMATAEQTKSKTVNNKTKVVKSPV